MQDNLHLSWKDYPVLGVTGGVASGKSTLAHWFEGWGACRVSADEIARELLAPGAETTRHVLAEFGPGIARKSEPETIDRRELAQFIYADESARRRLGEIMHPVIRERMRTQIGTHLSNPACPLVAVEIPLLYENNLEKIVSAVLVASCDEQTRTERLRARQPWLSDEDALRQVRSQMPLAEKASRADFVISTQQPMADAEREARALFDQLTNTSTSKQG